MSTASAIIRPIPYHRWVAVSYRKTDFIGRRAELDEIVSRFRSANIVVLTGKGTTALAMHYLDQERKKPHCYPGGVYWIDFRYSIPSQLKAIAYDLHLQDPSERIEVTVAKIRSYLEQHPGWLIVCDGVKKQDELTAFQDLEEGHLLVTTSGSMEHWENAIFLPPLSLEESKALLYRLTGRNGQRAEGVEEVANRLNGLPLSLVQVGAFINQIKTTYPAYFTELSKRGSDTLAAVMEITFNKIKDEFPDALQPLFLAAYTDSFNIPPSLLGADPDKFLPLFQFRLIFPGEGGTISIHRLIQAWLREKASQEEAKYYLQTLFDSLNKEWTFNLNYKTWTKARSLVQHVRACCHHGEGVEPLLRTVARFLDKLADYSQLVEKDFSQAISDLRKWVTVIRRVHGSKSFAFAEALERLGRLCKDEGKLSLAIEYFKYSAFLQKGSDDPKARACCQLLEKACQEEQEYYLSQGSVPLAIDRCKKSEEFWTELGDHSRVAACLNQLSDLYFRLGDFKSGLEYANLAKVMWEKLCNPHKIAETSHVIGDKLRMQGYTSLASIFDEEARLNL